MGSADLSASFGAFGALPAVFCRRMTKSIQTIALLPSPSGNFAMQSNHRIAQASAQCHVETASVVTELGIPLHLILAGCLLEPLQHRCGQAFSLLVACLYLSISCFHLHEHLCLTQRAIAGFIVVC